jgi:NitT/TauT family transport system ATP-binding protein
VGLAGFEKAFPWTLSGGMQQRANLCRSLIHEPKLLMLDEPFGALDSFTREELWGVLQDLWLQQHFTCVLVTHDLREAAFLADRVLVMSNRPARVVAEHVVDFPRPRSLRDTFAPEFVALLQQMGEQITEQRRAAMQGSA